MIIIRDHQSYRPGDLFRDDGLVSTLRSVKRLGRWLCLSLLVQITCGIVDLSSLLITCSTPSVVNSRNSRSTRYGQRVLLMRKKRTESSTDSAEENFEWSDSKHCQSSTEGHTKTEILSNRSLFKFNATIFLRDHGRWVETIICMLPVMLLYLNMVLNRHKEIVEGP